MGLAVLYMGGCALCGMGCGGGLRCCEDCVGVWEIVVWVGQGSRFCGWMGAGWFEVEKKRLMLCHWALRCVFLGGAWVVCRWSGALAAGDCGLTGR